MILIRLLIATSYTITVLIAKYLKVKALTIHFETFWFFTITSQLLYFLDFEMLFELFFFLINVHSPKVVNTNFFFLRKNNTLPVVKLMIVLSSCLHEKILLLVAIFWSLVIDRSMSLNDIGGVLNIHLILTVSFRIMRLVFTACYQRHFDVIFMSIFMQYLIMYEGIFLFYVDIMILFRKGR